MVRVLLPWSENIGKRVVKTPKVDIVVHAGGDTYPLSTKIRALAISRLMTELVEVAR